ncbi:MAG: ABC transporter permease [Firmicutes bacterium]|nr:ABC transporter permease [Bacillota bacterium]
MNKFFNKTIFKFEMRRNLFVVIMWAAIVSFFTIPNILIFPFMDVMMDMEGMDEMVADDGGIMDLMFWTLNSAAWFATMLDNIHMMGAIFACFMAIRMITNDAKDGTFEFLLTQPIKRSEVWGSKFAVYNLYIILFTLVMFLPSILLTIAFSPLGEYSLTGADIGSMFVMMLTSAISFIALGLLCYFISSNFSKRGGVAIAIGVGLVAWLVSMLAVMIVPTLPAGALRDFLSIIITVLPFYGSAGRETYLSLGSLSDYQVREMWYFWRGIIGLSIFLAATIAMVVMGYFKFNKKDIT